MLAAKIELKNAEKIKLILLEHDLIDTSYKFKKDNTKKVMYFPLKKRPNNKISGDFEIVDIDIKKKEDRKTVKTILKSKLNSKEIEMIPHSQEIVGDIMILEVPEEIKKHEKEIANAYLKLNKQIKTIVKKSENHSGIFRTRKVQVLAGESKKETIHTESGIRIKLDLEKSYFSARLGNERLRIASQIKNNEEILVMFSGSAPYPLVLAKHSQAKSILGIEINPMAHEFAQFNIKKNKCGKIIELINGDVRKILPDIKQKFDRILMPLPKTSEEFLDIALSKAKIGTIINLYSFLNENEIESYGEKIINEAKKNGYEIKIFNTVKCGKHAPYTYRLCYDLKVLTIKR